MLLAIKWTFGNGNTHSDWSVPLISASFCLFVCDGGKLPAGDWDGQSCSCLSLTNSLVEIFVIVKPAFPFHHHSHRVNPSDLWLSNQKTLSVHKIPSAPESLSSGNPIFSAPVTPTLTLEKQIQSAIENVYTMVDQCQLQPVRPTVYFQHGRVGGMPQSFERQELWWNAGRLVGLHRWHMRRMYRQDR